MRQLMADYGAYAAKVYGVIRFVAVKRRLQNACWKVDVVLARIVVGVHGGRRHAPLALVYCSADLVYIPPVLEAMRAQNIAGKIIPHHANAAVVAPVIGETYLV